MSTPRQARDDKISLEQQEAEGRAFAELHGGEVVKLYDVPGHTRKYVFFQDAARDMAAYAELLDDLQAGRLDVLFCHDEDRLGRRLALIAQVVALCEDHGCEVYSQTTPHVIGNKGEGGAYTTAIKGVQAEQELAKLAYRHAMGMRSRITKRGLIAGTWPFWLDPVRGPDGRVTHYIFNDRAAALDELTRLFLAGHSYAEMERRMAASPWPPPRSTRWLYVTIRDVMRSDLPAGVAGWGPYTTDGPSPHIPARWDTATWAAVIRERARRATGPYHRHGAGPLSGVVVCARCGARMTRSQNSRGTWYLRCSTHAGRYRYGRACHANHAREADVIEALAGWLDSLATPEVMDAALVESAGRRPLDAAAAERDDLLRRATGLEAERERLARAYRQGALPLDLVSSQVTEVDRLLLAARSRLADLERVVAAAPEPNVQRAMLADLAGSFRALAALGDAAEVSALLQRARVRVVVDGGAVTRIHLA